MEEARRSMTFLIWIGAGFLLLFSTMSYMPKSNLVTDLTSHFTPHYALACIIMLGAAFILKAQGQGVYLVLVTAFVLNVYQIMPFMRVGAEKPVQAGRAIKILQANVWILNHDTTGFRKLIDDENPDIIAAAEVHAPFVALFDDIKNIYPYQHVHGNDRSSFGIALLSKFPFESIEEKYLASPAIPSIFAKMRVEGKPLTLVALHASNPLRDLNLRDVEFEALAQWQQETKPENLVITGDLNATPWCPALRKMTQRMRLTNARTGRGLLGSFPAKTALPFLRISIDHLLAEETVFIEDFYMEADIGSDHLPTMTVIKL